MSAEGLMGPFNRNDPAAGTTGPWYTETVLLALTAGWHLDIWGKNRARFLPAWVRLKHGRRER